MNIYMPTYRRETKVTKISGLMSKRIMILLTPFPKNRQEKNCSEQLLNTATLITISKSLLKRDSVFPMLQEFTIRTKW